jgi:hypothetical protein
MKNTVKCTTGTMKLFYFCFLNGNVCCVYSLLCTAYSFDCFKLYKNTMVLRKAKLVCVESVDCLQQNYFFFFLLNNNSGTIKYQNVVQHIKN